MHLRCEADGDQPMDVTWKAKGSRIESDYEMRYVTLFLLYVSTVVCRTITFYYRVHSYRQISLETVKNYFFSTIAEYFGVLNDILASDSGDCMF